MWLKKKCEGEKATVFHEISYEFQANPKFVLNQGKSDGLWRLSNDYNGKQELFEESDIAVIKEIAFNHIISKIFEDILRATSAACDMLEILDQTINNILELGINDVIINSAGQTQPFKLDTLTAVLKQNCLEKILKTKTKNHLKDGK